MSMMNEGGPPPDDEVAEGPQPLQEEVGERANGDAGLGPDVADHDADGEADEDLGRQARQAS